MKVEKSLPASRMNLLNATVVPVQVFNANPAFVSEGFHLVHIAECNNNKTLADKKKLVKAKVCTRLLVQYMYSRPVGVIDFTNTTYLVRVRIQHILSLHVLYVYE